jgi:hypothetical protein
VLPRLARHVAFRLAFFAVLATLLVWPVLGDAARLNEFRDVHHLHLYERVAIDTLRQFGELPLWNPYYCGGFDAVAAPQTRFVAPSLALGLLFGAERAEILTVFFLAVIGMEGMYRWLRLRVTSPVAALLVAPVFALSGQFAVAYYRGWIQFFGFHLVPWILYGVTLAVRRRLAGVVVASSAFALMVGFAGLFAAPMVAVAGALEAARALLEEPRRGRGRSLVMLAMTASFMGAVACVRLWPVTETLLSAPRLMAGTPGHAPRALVSALVGALAVKDGNTDFSGSFYVGAAFLGLVALGAHDRRGARGLALALLMTWTAAGYARSPSLFGLLREVPMFAALRYPERFLWLGVLFASESAATAVARVPLVGEGRTWRVGLALALGAALAWTVASELGAFHRVALARALSQVTEAPTDDFHQARGNRWMAVHLQAIGVGSLGCYETHRLAQSPLLRGDLPAEEYLAPDDVGAGSVARRAWSPNRIQLRVEVTRPARVLVNQNWAPGWHASTGAVVSHEGLLAVDVPAGAHDVTLSFLPWSTVGGAATTLTALLSLGLLGWRARRGRALLGAKARAVTALLVLAPWAVAGVAYAASPDPRWPPPRMTNANGAPALVAEGALPPDALVSGAAFDVPLRIEAGTVSPVSEQGTVTVEVFLRRIGRLPRTTTTFVHLERRRDERPTPEGREGFFNADHQVVGGSFYLSDAPEGRLVHDVFGVHLDKAATGTWDVWVGCGHVSGRNGRHRVASPGAATVSGDRVKVGTFVVP